MRITALTLLALTSAAAAEPAPAAAHDGDAVYDFGVRVGGYGFRREGGSGTDAWNECRMNGLGVFAHRALRGPLFVEAGLDAYSSINQAMPTDLPIDRQSALLSVAAGVQTHITSWLRGYAQLGIGAELARVAVPYGDSTIRDNKVLPDGFFGIGGDLRIAHATYLGMTMRTLVMGNFEYDPQRLQMSNQWVAPPSSSDVFAASPDLVEQFQFYLRRDI